MTRSIGDVAGGVLARDRVAVEDHVDQAEHHAAGAVRETGLRLGVLAGPRLDGLVLGVRDQDQAVGQAGQPCEHAVPFVLHQGPALAVAHVAFVFDVVLGADVLAAELEGVVDRVDDDRLERMVALGDQLAGGQEVVPRVRGDLEDFQVVQARLAFEEDGLGKAAGEGRLSQLGSRVEQDRSACQIGGRFGALRW